jgi:hypothetical protein
MDRIEPLDPIERMEPLDPIDRIDPVDPAEASDPTEKTEPNENAEPTDAADSAEPSDRHESTDHHDLEDARERATAHDPNATGDRGRCGGLSRPSHAPAASTPPGEKPADWWNNPGYQQAVAEQARRDGALTGQR